MALAYRFTNLLRYGRCNHCGSFWRNGIVELPRTMQGQNAGTANISGATQAYNARIIICRTIFTSNVLLKRRETKKTVAASDKTADRPTINMDEWEEKMRTAAKHLQQSIERLKEGPYTLEAMKSLRVSVGRDQFVLTSVASITEFSRRRIVFSCFDKAYIKPVLKAVIEQYPNLNAQESEDGENSVVVQLPPVTRETRVQQVDEIAKLGEHAKSYLRNLRQDLQKKLDAMKSAGESSDYVHRLKSDTEKVFQKHKKNIEDQTAEAQRQFLKK